MTNYTQYRFTTAGGKVSYAFIKDGDVADIKAKMRTYRATKAESVAGSCPIQPQEEEDVTEGLRADS